MTGHLLLPLHLHCFLFHHRRQNLVGNLPYRLNQNLGFLDIATSTLKQIATNPSTPKNIRKNIADIIEELKSDEYSISVRAANTISLLDDVTQDPNLPSYVRTQLWQAVSKLESIRE